MGDFRDLLAWRQAHAQAISVYRLTDVFPSVERFGLALQLRRAAVSVTSNLAEGSMQSHREFARFVSIARASAAEVRSQLLLARDLGYLDGDTWQEADAAAHRVGRLLTGLLGYLRQRPKHHGRKSGESPTRARD